MQPAANDKKRVLLILPAYSFLYQGTTIKEGAPYSPHMGLAALAGALAREEHLVRILDLNRCPENSLSEALRDFSPDYAGISFVTPLSDTAARIAAEIKTLKNDTKVLAGGPHPTALPEEVLKSKDIDLVCLGEADQTILDVVGGKDYTDIPAIAYNSQDGFRINERQNFIEDLDSLAPAAWGLFQIQSYKTTRLLARKNPVGWIETSRGCPYGCVYCTKKVLGRNFRPKSPKRVVDEMEHILACGFREIHVADDCFSFDLERAKQICAEIMKRGLKFPWAIFSGIRADKVDQELMHMMKRSGCYRVSFGIESGDDRVLKCVRKGETCDHVRKAVKMAKKAGMEVFGFFMLALPGESEESMQRTVDFACELDLDLAKVSITIPLPSTPLFEELAKNGRIKKTDWTKYNLYFPARQLYDHPSVDWDRVEVYYKKFYQSFYLRPQFLVKRFIKGLLEGTLASDLLKFFRTRW